MCLVDTQHLIQAQIPFLGLIYVKILDTRWKKTCIMLLSRRCFLPRVLGMKEIWIYKITKDAILSGHKFDWRFPPSFQVDFFIWHAMMTCQYWILECKISIVVDMYSLPICTWQNENKQPFSINQSKWSESITRYWFMKNSSICNNEERRIYCERPHWWKVSL